MNNTQKSFLVLAFGCCASFVAIDAASADPVPVLPDAYANVVLAGDVNYRSVGMDVQNGYQGAPGLGAPASYAGTLTPSPYISGSIAIATESSGADQSVTNQLYYYFEVTTPKITSVPMIINTAGSFLANTTGSVYPSANLTVSLGGVGTIASLYCLNNCSAETFSVSSPQSIESNSQYEIGLSMSLVTNINGVGGGSVVENASIDPTISIDPTFLADNPEAQLIFSQNVGNVSAVPESSTWAMMLLGFGGVGFMAHRRKSPLWRCFTAGIAYVA